MQRRAFETMNRVRGESWLLSYAVPGGPQVLELTWDSAEAIERRMFREGSERLLSCVVLGALRKEKEKLGRVAGHQIIGKTLSPVTIAKVADEYQPEKLHAKGRAVLRQFQKDELAIMGDAHA